MTRTVTTYLLATCSKCDHVTHVTEAYYPATRWDPADGERHPEACEECGEEFGEETGWAEDEPPDPY
jgi:hypothetical protein